MTSVTSVVHRRGLSPFRETFMRPSSSLAAALGAAVVFVSATMLPRITAQLGPRLAPGGGA